MGRFQLGETILPEYLAEFVFFLFSDSVIFGAFLETGGPEEKRNTDTR